MDILCTGKTGSLTQDKIALARHADAYGQDTDEVLNFAFLNSRCQTGLKNLLDRAVLARVELAAELKLNEAYRKVDEIPFDFERRRMSVVVAALVAGQEHHHELICKGAVEEVLAACTQVRAQDPTDASLDGDRTMPTLALDGPRSPLAGYFKLHALPPAYYARLLVILVGYSVLISVMKRLYVRRYCWQ